MSLAPPEIDVTQRGPEAGARSEDYLWTLNFGPQHPATHTTLRLVLKLEGERVVDAMPEIGYLHSGFEKIGEHLTFNQYVTVTDRMNYISPMANNVAWHHAVETLLGLELTPRCKYIRTIIAEPAIPASAAAGLEPGHAADAFFARALAKDPKDRFATAHEMSFAISELAQRFSGPSSRSARSAVRPPRAAR